MAFAMFAICANLTLHNICHTGRHENIHFFVQCYAGSTLSSRYEIIRVPSSMSARLVTSHPPSTHSVSLVAKFLHSKWRTATSEGSAQTAAPHKSSRNVRLGTRVYVCHMVDYIRNTTNLV